jgi:Cu/Zn superoxide dismutase
LAATTIPSFITLTALALAGCGSTGSSFQSMFEPMDGKRPRGRTTASLPSSAASARRTRGEVRVTRSQQTALTVLVSASNLPPNQYRVSFHVNGNCSSARTASRQGPPVRHAGT